MSRTLVALPTGAIVSLAHGGRPHARRVVVMCSPPGYAGFVDPDPLVTADFAVDIACLDPVTTGTQSATVSPTEHAATIAECLRGLPGAAARLDAGDGRVGLVGWGDGALVATALVLDHPGLVDRIALVGASFGHDGDPIAGDDAAPDSAGAPTDFERRLRRSLVEREARRGARVVSSVDDGLRERWERARQDGRDILSVDAGRSAPAALLVAAWRRVLDHLVRPDGSHHLDASVLR